MTVTASPPPRASRSRRVLRRTYRVVNATYWAVVALDLLVLTARRLRAARRTP